MRGWVGVYTMGDIDTDYQKVVRAGDQKSDYENEIVEITTGIFFFV